MKSEIKVSEDALKNISKQSDILSKRFQEYQKKVDGQEYNSETKQEFAVKMIIKRKI